MHYWLNRARSHWSRQSITRSLSDVFFTLGFSFIVGRWKKCISISIIWRRSLDVYLSSSLSAENDDKQPWLETSIPVVCHWFQLREREEKNRCRRERRTKQDIVWTDVLSRRLVVFLFFSWGKLSMFSSLLHPTKWLPSFRFRSLGLGCCCKYSCPVVIASSALCHESEATRGETDRNLWICICVHRCICIQDSIN